jgi:uncharacterized membrane protein
VSLLPASSRLNRQILASIGGLVLIAAVAFLPDLGRPVADEERGVVTAFRGRIVAINQPPVDPDPGTPPVPSATVTALDGPRAGETFEALLAGPGGSQSIAGYEAGDEVVVTITQAPDGGEPFVAVSDRWRLPSLQLLALVFAAAVLVVGGWHGARALVALGLTIAVIVKVLLPLVISGVAPVPLAVAAATGITVVTIALTEGLRRSSFAAILGTAGSLALTGLLGAGLTAAMDFTYLAGSDLAFLATQGGQGLDLRGVLLAAFILGAVGVLDDVTVTQAALVDELAGRGGLRGRDLTRSAMAIGRSHIAATVNTLFLAYVGAGLPLLVVLLVSRLPTELVLNDEVIATEIVRALVGSLGILAAVPLTTFIAVSLLPDARAPAPGWGTGPSSRRRGVLLGAGLVGALLLATAALPAMTSGPRAPLSPDVFDPGASVPVAPSVPPAGEMSPLPEPDDPLLVGIGDPVPIEVDGRAVGTVVVTDLRRDGAAPPQTSDRVLATVDYTAVESFPLTAGSWVVLLSDGSEVPLVEPDGAASAGPVLGAGETVTVRLEGEIPRDAVDPFLIYLDLRTSAYVVALPIE